MAPSKGRILAVDDEPRYLWAIRAVLDGVGYETLTASDGQTAIDRAAIEQPDLILLDLRLPDLDGYEVCQRVREFSTTPIIMLTALTSEVDRVRGLEAGADDYVTKPFGAQELVARVRAVLRRAQFSGTHVSSAVLRAGDLQVDLAGRRVTIRGEPVSLTATEYRLLCAFVSQPDRVWGVGYEGENHMLRQVVHRLRRKIEPDPRNPQYLQTRPGLGYVFVRPAQT